MPLWLRSKTASRAPRTRHQRIQAQPIAGKAAPTDSLSTMGPAIQSPARALLSGLWVRHREGENRAGAGIGVKRACRRRSGTETLLTNAPSAECHCPFCHPARPRVAHTAHQPLKTAVSSACKNIVVPWSRYRQTPRGSALAIALPAVASLK